MKATKNNAQRFTFSYVNYCFGHSSIENRRWIFGKVFIFFFFWFSFDSNINWLACDSNLLFIFIIPYWKRRMKKTKKKQNIIIIIHIFFGFVRRAKQERTWSNEIEQEKWKYFMLLIHHYWIIVEWNGNEWIILQNYKWHAFFSDNITFSRVTPPDISKWQLKAEHRAPKKQEYTE